MSRPTDLPTELQHEVAARTAPPGFDAVLDRAAAGRRRRRTTIASVLGAAVVVGGLGAAAGGLVGSDGGSPDPARPAPSTPWDGSSSLDPRLPSSVRAVLDDDRLQLWTIVGDPDGAMSALWRGCDFDPCQFAVVSRSGDEVTGAVLGASFPSLTTVPGGWLVEDGGFTRLTPTGDRSEIYDTGPGSGEVMPGDTVVSTAEGWRLLRGTKLVPLPTPDGGVVTGAYVTPGGRLVAATSGPGSRFGLATLGPGESWGSSMNPVGSVDGAETASTVLVAGNGDHVVLAVLGDDPDGSIPVLGVQVSHDAGRTWSPVRGLDTDGGDRLRDTSSLAMAPDGTAWLATVSHHLVRIDADGDALPLQLSSFDTNVFAVGDGVCAVTERGRYDALACSTDGGTTWSDQPLPGFR